ncbi:MAG TPA: DUF6114 domain-containing protein [Streptosporangiaceae bacterium]|nr:DUF6114 domain-containing protein [Streptosporangiaceae bacterium]
MLTVEDSYGGGDREPEASDEYETVELGPIRRALLAWQRWRRTRPFWGGLLIILGGGEMLLSEQAPLPIVIHVGAQGLAGYLVPIVLVLCGVLLWLSPTQQTFYSVLAVVLALGSWVTSNLGGFFVGLLLGVIGGALAFAWQRGEEPGPSLREELGGPGKTPSEGLGLILGDEAPDDPDDDAERQGAAPLPQHDGKSLPQEDAEPLPKGAGGESRGSLRADGVITGISALPLMLVILPRASSPSLTPSPGEHHPKRCAASEHAADPGARRGLHGKSQTFVKPPLR